MANSEDPNEMPHNAAFHQGLHCLLRQNLSSENLLKIIACDPSIYTKDHPDPIVCSFMENSIGLERVKPHKPSIPFVGHRQIVQPQNAPSDQGPLFLLTEWSIKIKNE